MGWLTEILAALSFLAAGFIFSPGTKLSAPSTFMKLAHLLSFSTTLGPPCGWVNFVGGIVMFKTLPRHQFGNLRSNMFPAYFSVAGICCAFAVASFCYLHPWRTSSVAHKYQLCVLISSLAFNVSNFFVFVPITIKIVKQRHKIEREENIEDFGWAKNVEVAKFNPKLAAMNNKFGIIHRLAAGADILAICSLIMHTWYLAGKLHLN